MYHIYRQLFGRVRESMVEWGDQEEEMMYGEWG